MNIGRIGAWQAFASASAPAVRRASAEIERLGYSTLWAGESPTGREAFSNAAIMLGATEHVTVATGIANLWARDATAMAAGAEGLGEAYPGRFVLGVGVSHALLASWRGHDYTRPLTVTAGYLEAMSKARENLDVHADPPVPTVLAALRTRMLELARDLTAGAHSYFVPPEHTARARAVLGPGKLLAPEQAIVIETDPSAARRTARAHMEIYLGLPNYVNALRELGFDEDDLSDGGSDRLVDSIVAWGDAETVATRIHAHLDAGADHVAVQALPGDVSRATAQLAELAPALGLTPRG
ncbi:TIGR03620 family F420-dependent LLM class oxidoreductase [Spongiactinospora sp. TRM90649]|uniref:TIGR03620 family F420-dependent LLM class oxidoreductase n=1 Tax=Spongiactinospora sp. TRM90649 TaxID=3031114 RepID=UPI0023F6CC01|nr:TIGR03620 family F420-dependent LLM class oxidoreductase [Spongiactinospora sp. TRM90649]MDF5757087.1 TIGR03620 family F420-dependent LLM class oxidoreductase [Spongiactinospora sp. TRM90649]